MSWLRAINSAQRLVTISDEMLKTQMAFNKVEFHIQGINAFEGSRVWQETYVAMVDRGIREEREKPLSVIQRLMRQEAMLGHAYFENDVVVLTLWTDPRLILTFDLSDTDQYTLFRESEIMILSAGFHFRVTGETVHESKAKAF